MVINAPNNSQGVNWVMFVSRIVHLPLHLLICANFKKSEYLRSEGKERTYRASRASLWILPIFPKLPCSLENSLREALIFADSRRKLQEPTENSWLLFVLCQKIGRPSHHQNFLRWHVYRANFGAINSFLLNYEISHEKCSKSFPEIFICFVGRKKSCKIPARFSAEFPCEK